MCPFIELLHFLCSLALLICPGLSQRLRYLSSLLEEFEGCGSGCGVGLMNGPVSDVQPPRGAKRDSYLVTEQDTSLFFYCFQTAQREIKPSLANRNRKKEEAETGNSIWILTVYTYIHTEMLEQLESQLSILWKYPLAKIPIKSPAVSIHKPGHCFCLLKMRLKRNISVAICCTLVLLSYFIQCPFHSGKTAVIEYCDRILACPCLSVLPSRGQSCCVVCAKGLYTRDKEDCNVRMEYQCIECCLLQYNAKYF